MGVVTRPETMPLNLFGLIFENVGVCKNTSDANTINDATRSWE